MIVKLKLKAEMKPKPKMKPKMKTNMKPKPKAMVTAMATAITTVIATAAITFYTLIGFSVFPAKAAEGEEKSEEKSEDNSEGKLEDEAEDKGETSEDHVEISRIEGENFLELNLELVRQYWESEGSSVVILVRADDFADALAGVPLAYYHQAPVFMVSPEGVPEELCQEIDNLNAKEAIILGGEEALPYQVESDLEDIGLEVERIGGNDRYHTAQKVAELMGFAEETAMVVSGEDFPDALSAGAYAARKGYPILLSRSHVLPEPTKSALDGLERTFMVGGTAAIGEEVEKELPSATRIWGEDRYETSLEVAQQQKWDGRELFLTSGSHYGSPLLASLLAGLEGKPLLLGKDELVNQEDDDEIRPWLSRNGLADDLERVTIIEGKETEEALKEKEESASEAEQEEEPESDPEPVFTQRGTASWYGGKFHGRTTASGEIFRTDQLTAAYPIHDTDAINFGTKVEVEHLATGQKVTVRINDYGPHIPGRIIDLSKAAAEAIGLKSKGLGEVKLRVYE